MLRHTVGHLAPPSFFRLRGLPRLLEAADRLVSFLGHDLEARHQGLELRLQIVNCDIVVLHGKQRCYIWVHESSDTL
jgi:hypothetical protein